MTRTLALTTALLAAASLTTACASTDDGRWVELKGKRLSVEIADDDDERRRGLMFRDELAADSGMLFVHEREEPQAYWMKNTRIPLDILYFDSKRRLVSVQRRVPPCSAGDRCPPYPSEGTVLYVLELNAGMAEKLGVASGDEIRFGPEVIAPSP